MSESVRVPPRSVVGILAACGPGMIVAGSIVGSGELIATTKTGAEVGFTLLWLILIGCVIKVFVQVELGRRAVITNETTLVSLDKVPGPRFGRRGNWLVWYWLVMWVAGIGQLGGIAGGVGQALAMAVPVTSPGEIENVRVRSRLAEHVEAASSAAVVDGTDVETPNPLPDPAAHSHDPLIWAFATALVTSALLAVGRFGMIERVSTVFVLAFTALTVLNLVLLQSDPAYGLRASELWGGLWPRLPPADRVVNPMGTALATLGIIGVGAAELVVYPYWCLEKGYAKDVGPPDPSNASAWIARYQGWMRVMRWDAWGSMVLYTLSTAAFYLLGAATLWRLGLNPGKDELIPTLSVIYLPVFGRWAEGVFLVGAVAVLYSTFFVANASHARTFSDALRVIGVIGDGEADRRRWVWRLSVLFPWLCLLIFVAFPNPAELVLISGVFQGVMLPMLALAAVYFRYAHTPAKLKPSKPWDVCLWMSSIVMLMIGVWIVTNRVGQHFHGG